MESWHNIRLTRRLPDGSMVIESDFEMSLHDAVDTAVFNNRGILDLHKAEFSGPAAGIHFRDVTEQYKNLYHIMTHDEPAFDVRCH